jgi:hypothetical protein
MKRVTSLMIGLCIFMLFLSPAFADGDVERVQPTVGMKVLDLLIVRPLGIVLSAGSTAFYILTVPITFPAGVSEPAARMLVETPWKYTGMRCLGDFQHYKDGSAITVIPEE